MVEGVFRQENNSNLYLSLPGTSIDAECPDQPGENDAVLVGEQR